jgi:large subunit ribosomal protein L3
MGNVRKPRHGSMQFWPRKRARRPFARIRNYAKSKKPVLGFAGYKVGMTQVMLIDNGKKSMTKGEEIAVPVTVIECPPLKIASIRLYSKDVYGIKLVKEIVGKADKELGRTIPIPKKEGKLDGIKPEDYYDIRINAYTQPKLTGIGKKKPELFELQLNGSNADKFKYASENLGKEILVTDMCVEGEQLDMHAITKGKGFQGPVKRFGVQIRSHKAEKTKRGPGSLGGWKSQGHVMYRVAHAGQTGYHQRIEANKWLIKISNNPAEVNPKGGFLHYGTVKGQYMLVKGSVQGPCKRLIRFTQAAMPKKNVPTEQPTITLVSLESKQ